jgi:hypothetical protein
MQTEQQQGRKQPIRKFQRLPNPPIEQPFTDMEHHQYNCNNQTIIGDHNPMWDMTFNLEHLLVTMVPIKPDVIPGSCKCFEDSQ